LPTFANILTVLSPLNLVACFFGVLCGTVVGVLPGLGPVTTMALVLPLTFHWPADTSLIMLAGIYYGAMYGGSTTSILLNVPGEAASVVTCLDGYPMAQKGRGGAALSVSAIGSFVAGTLGVLGLSLVAPPVAQFAITFGPPEYLAIGILGLVLLANLTGGDSIKNWIMVIAGLAIGTVGMDPFSGRLRYDFGIHALASGIGLVPVIMGLFGIAELLRLLEHPETGTPLPKIRLRDLYPTRTELTRSIPPMFRGGILGFFVGLLPGPAAVIAAFASYSMERRISKHPEEFGKGAIEGVAGPEAANNAACSGTLVPLVTLGFPFGPAAAMLLAGFMIHGVRPGPLFLTQQADLFWTVIASMYLGNVLLLILNLPMVGVFANIVRTPSKYLIPIVLAICIIGAYGDSNNAFGVVVMLAAGFLGYALTKHGYSPAPLVVGMVISPILENAVFQTLLIHQGRMTSLFERPVFTGLLVIALAVLTLPLARRLFRRKAVHAP
jgi:putative tricarboxylic transport membrane protein